MVDGNHPCPPAQSHLSSENMGKPYTNNSNVIKVTPCTPFQEAMIACTKSYPHLYWSELRAKSACVISLSPDQVGCYVKSLILRHEILRTGFQHYSGEFGTESYLQLTYADAFSNQIVVHDESLLGLYDDKTVIKDLEARRVDLEFPPFYATLVRKLSGHFTLTVLLHHCVYDGWSWDILLRDLDTLLKGEQLSPSKSFCDISRYLSCNDPNHIPFWKEYLKDYTNVLLVPKLITTITESLKISKAAIACTDEVESLEAICKNVSFSPESIIQLSWGLLLSKLSDIQDVVFGVAKNGRLHDVDGIYATVGPFVTVLPIRLSVIKETSLLKSLQELYTANCKITENELQVRQIRRQFAQNTSIPLFDSLVVYQASMLNHGVDSQSIFEKYSEKDATDIPAIVEFDPHRNILSLTFHESLMDQESAQIILQQMQDIMICLISLLRDSPNSTLGDVHIRSEDLLSSDTRSLDTSSGFEGIIPLFENVANKYSDRIAIEFSPIDLVHYKSLSYRELNNWANQLARQLKNDGIGAGDFIVIIMDKSIELYVSILGVLKSGAAYVPLLPDTPPKRLEFIHSDIKPKLTLVNYKANETSYGKIMQVPPLDDLETPNIGLNISPDSPAYVIYTSGTTGTPKGVMCSHSNLASNNQTLRKMYFTPSAGDRFMQFCSYIFDVSIFEIFYSWTTGITLCSAPKEMILDDITSFINARNITHLSLTPTVASLIERPKCPGVKFLVVAGENITSTIINEWAGSDTVLVNGYGPTEVTNVSVVNYNMKLEDRKEWIGRGLPDVSVYVFSSENALAPVGCLGELVLGGPQVALGYVRSEGNEGKFIMHDRYGKLYRTGDFARMNIHKDIFFGGRRDGQIKIRGQRVDVSEISGIFESYGFLCYTDIIDLDGNGPTLVSIISTERSAWETGKNVELVESSATRQLLSSACSECEMKLPIYMRPELVFPVNYLPLNPAGKIHRMTVKELPRSLPRSVRSNYEFSSFLRSSDGSDGEAIESDLTEEMREKKSIIREALSKLSGVHQDQIIDSTSIFGLGIDSIGAVQLSKLLSTKGIVLSTSAILRLRTLKSMYLDASLSISATSGSNVDNLLAVGRLKNEAILTRYKNAVIERLGSDISDLNLCTALQDRMLSTLLQEDTKTLYLSHLLLKLNDDCDQMKLRECVEDANRQYEIFRTCFVMTGDLDRPFIAARTQSRDLHWSDHFIQNGQLKEVLSDLEGTFARNVTMTLPMYQFDFIKSSNEKYLLFSMHHALFDAYSRRTLLDDIFNHYSGKPLLNRSSIKSFMDYYESLDMQKAVDAFCLELANFEPHPFPSLTRSIFNDKESSLFQVESNFNFSGLSQTCITRQWSISTLFHSIWANLLQIYLGNKDVCFGVAVGERLGPIEGFREVLGPLFNIVPLRCFVDDSKSRESLMQGLMEKESKFVYSCHAPLRLIQANFSQGSKLFDTLVIFQEKPTEPNSLYTEIRDSPISDCSVCLEIVPGTDRDSFTFRLHSSSNILDEASSSVILQLLQGITTAFLHHPDSPSSSWTSGRSEIPLSISGKPAKRLGQPNSLLHDAFEEISRRHPDADALNFWGQEPLSYAELNKASNSLGRRMLDLGIRRQSTVVLFLRKSIAYYVSLLATLKIGSIFVPIDVSSPPERLKLIMTDLCPDLALAEGDGAADLRSRFASQLILDTSNFDFKHSEDAELPPVDVTPQDSAYYIYTSGSTGIPKAVDVGIGNAVQTILSSKELVSANHGRRFLQYAATTFDMHIYDCFMAWSYGLTLCSAPQDKLISGLVEVINKLDVSIIDLTPSVALTLKPENVPSIRILYCIGEKMSPQLVSDWGSKCLNSYGPTEAAMCCSIFPCSQAVKSSIVGRPFPSTEFLILDPTSHEILPLQAVGELAIAGYQTARGYNKNRELTTQKFLHTNSAPSSPSDPERMYLTGDMARMNASLEVEILGRIDDQVKLRGQRIELGEIVSAIQTSPMETSSTECLILRNAKHDVEQIVAFIVLQDVDEPYFLPRSHETWKHLTGRIPPYMMPSHILCLHSLPLSTAGKLNRKKMQRIFDSMGEETSNISSGELKGDSLTVANVLGDLCNIDPKDLSEDTTIYDIGLDSISAIQIIARLKDRGFALSAYDIFKNPTVSGISSVLAPFKKPSEAKKMSHSIVSSSRSQFFSSLSKSERAWYDDYVENVLPCTAIQEGMLSQFMNPDAESYFNSTLFALDDDVDFDRLYQCVSQLLCHVEILRTGFVLTKDNDYVQIIYKFSKLEKLRPTVSKLYLTPTEDWLREWNEQLANTARDAQYLPQICLSLLADSNGKNHFVFTGMHALYDAISLDYLFSDLWRLYKGNTLPKRVSMEKCVERQLEDTKKCMIEGQNFWKNYLGGTGFAKFPDLNICSRPMKETRQACKTSKFSVQNLKESASLLGVSVSAIVLSGWLKVLCAYVGERELITGLVLSGRVGAEDLKDSIYPWVVTLPFKAEINGSNLELLRNVSSGISQLFPYQRTPLGDIQKWSSLEGQRLMDTLFVYQPRSEERKSWSRLYEVSAHEYPVALEVEELSQCTFSLSLYYSLERIPEQQAHLILGQLEEVILDICKCPNESVDSMQLPESCLSITPASEINLPVASQTLHGLVRETVKLHPEKIALEFIEDISETQVCSRKWTYRELDAEALKVASYLSSLGVGRNDIVIICLDKSPYAVFSMYGVLLSGGSILAVDVNAPEERIAFIAKDSGSKVILTNDDLASRLQSSNSQNAKIIVVEDIFMKTPPASLELPFVASSDLCYSLYTSGSTGAPKGCMLTHENAVQAMAAFTELFSPRYNDKSVLLQFASYHFDVSILEHFWSWSVGIKVVAAPKDLVLTNLALLIQKLDINILDLTPALAVTLKRDDAPSLKDGIFITGGELLRQEILENWADCGSIFNAYGPTEVTIGCTMHPQIKRWTRPSNIGRQFLNVSSAVLLPGTNYPTLRGALGELCVGGKLVGKGYIGREDLTASKFIKHPRLHGRSYRTGDLVRQMFDDSFDYCGREDSQVKLRGQRLEIGEIDSVIKRGGAKDSCTLVLRHEQHSSDQLVCFFTGNSSLKPRLLKSCQRHLPAYMIPTYFIFLSKLPLSKNNKVDNRALADLYKRFSLEALNEATAQSTTREPNEIENQIRQIVAKYLGLEARQISLRSSFFHLGIDSVDMTKLCRKFKDLNSNVTVSSILHNPSVELLAEFITGGSGINYFSRTVDFSPLKVKFATLAAEKFGLPSTDSIEDIYPSSALQEGIFARIAFNEDFKAAYFTPFRFQLANSINIDRLLACLHKIFQRYPIYRTLFLDTNDGLLQVVLKSFDEAEGIMRRRSLLSYSVSRENDESFFTMQLFHGLYDGESLDMLLKDMKAEYLGKALPERPAFKEVIEKLYSFDLDKARAFWIEQLKNSPPCHLSTSGRGQKSKLISFIPKNLKVQSLKEASKSLQSTLQAVFQSIWLTYLSKVMDKSDIITGTIASGRTLPVNGADKVMGPLFNIIPLKISFHPGTSFSEIIRQVHEYNIRCHDLQATPLRRINQWLKIDPLKGLFNTLFVFQHQEVDTKAGGNEIWSMMDNHTGRVSDFACACECELLKSGDVQISLNILEAAMESSPVLLNAVEEFESVCIEVMKSIANNSALGISTDNPAGEVSDSDSNDNSESSHFVWTETSYRLRELLCNQAKLPLDIVGANTSIFQLGLDSVDAVRLSSLFQSQNIPLSATEILSHPSIMAMSLIIESKLDIHHLSRSHYPFEDLAKHMKHDGKAYPCTPMQDGILLEYLRSEGTLYSNSAVLELESSVDAERLHRAWIKAIEEAEILRSHFALIDNDTLSDGGYNSQFAMLVNEKPQLEWRNYNIGSNYDSKVSEVAECLRQECNPLRRPPISVALVTAENRRALVLCIHHVLYDGLSLDILLKRVASIYDGNSVLGRHCPRDSVERIVSSYVPARDDSYWYKKIRYLDIAPFPRLSDLSRTSAGGKSEVSIIELSSSMSSSQCQEFCKQNGVTLQTLGQSCFATMLSHYTGRSNIAFATIFSGRETDEERELIFPMMTTYPVIANIIGGGSDLLKKLQRLNSENLKHRFIPFGKIKQFFRQEGTESCLNTLFIMQSRLEESEEKAALWRPVSGFSEIEYPLAIEMNVTQTDEVVWLARCHSGYISASSLGIIVKVLDAFLVDFLTTSENSMKWDPEVPRELLSYQEARSLTRKDNKESLLGMFERTAFRHTNLVALEIYDPQSKALSSHYSYGALNELAENLAASLRKAAVHGTLICILMPPGLHYYVSILAVLKADAGYLLIDQTSSQKSIERLLSTCGPAFLLWSDQSTQLISTIKNDYTPVFAVEKITLSANHNHTLSRPTAEKAPICLCYSEGKQLSIRPIALSVLTFASGLDEPKMIALPDESAVQLTLSFGIRLPHAMGDHFLHLPGYSTCCALLECFFSWNNAMTVLSVEGILNPEALKSCLNNREVSHMYVSSRLDPTIFDGVNQSVQCLVGQYPSVVNLRERGLGERLFSLYGSDETAGFTSIGTFDGSSAEENIGKAFPIYSVIVVSEDFKVEPRGAPGRLCLGGPYMLDGSDPKTFKSNLLENESLLVTDDVVRMLPDGTLQFCGNSKRPASPKTSLPIESSTGEDYYFDEVGLRIRNVLSQVSKIPEVDIKGNQSFFQMGLDSIAAISIASKLRKEGVFLAVSEILSAGTIQKMSILIRSRSPDTVKAGPAVQRAHEKVYPATPLQVYTISAFQKYGKRLFYPIFLYSSGAGVLNDEVLKRSWVELIKNNRILRTVFTNNKGSLIQVVLDAEKFPANSCYDSLLSESEYSTETLRERHELIAEHAGPRRLTVTHPPVKLVHVQFKDRSVVAIQIHHALYDGWSLPQIINQLMDIYSARKLVVRPSFDRFLQFFSSQDVESNRHFWRQYLENTRSTLAITEEPQSWSRVSALLASCLSKTEVTILGNISRQLQISLSAILLTSFGQYFAQLRHISAPYVAFGIYLSGRTCPVDGIDEMAGPTANIVPLKVPIFKSSTKRELAVVASEVQESLNLLTSESYAHTELRKIREWTGVEIDACVNILQIPKGNYSEDKRPTLIPIGDIDGSKYESSEEMPHMERLPIDENLKVHLDVEIAINDEGAMDIGVFGLTDIVQSDNAAISFIQDFLATIRKSISLATSTV